MPYEQLIESQGLILMCQKEPELFGHIPTQIFRSETLQGTFDNVIVFSGGNRGKIQELG